MKQHRDAKPRSSEPDGRDFILQDILFPAIIATFGIVFALLAKFRPDTPFGRAIVEHSLEVTISFVGGLVLSTVYGVHRKLGKIIEITKTINVDSYVSSVRSDEILSSIKEICIYYEKIRTNKKLTPFRTWIDQSLAQSVVVCKSVNDGGPIKIGEQRAQFAEMMYRKCSKVFAVQPITATSVGLIGRDASEHLRMNSDCVKRGGSVERVFILDDKITRDALSQIVLHLEADIRVSLLRLADLPEYITKPDHPFDISVFDDQYLSDWTYSSTATTAHSTWYLEGNERFRKGLDTRSEIQQALSSKGLARISSQEQIDDFIKLKKIVVVTST